MAYELYNQFIQLLKDENKPEAVKFALKLLDDGILTIEQLYIELLVPSLQDFYCEIEDEDICIWKEHYRTSIIRTILECTYPYVIKRRSEVSISKAKIVVLTPAFEYHEIGAILNTNLMLLVGLDATYIGANTPKQDILSALRAFSPDYIALSVTNPYNIVITKQVTDEIKRFFPEVKIILGGQAFKNESAIKTLQYDQILQSYEDLIEFRKKVGK